MFRNRFFRLFVLSLLLTAVLGVSAMYAAPTLAHKPVAKSVNDMYWWWDKGIQEEVMGETGLLRTPNGVRGKIVATDLPPGQVMTMWFMVFNNPAGCSTNPCSIPADVFNPDAQADFLWGGGKAVNKHGRVVISGFLPVGDASASGMPEIGYDDLALGLLDPMNAEVVLALHSHGPALSGDDLAAQFSSFTGGCSEFLGVDGFAGGPEDLPVSDGQCSTITYSVHQP